MLCVDGKGTFVPELQPTLHCTTVAGVHRQLHCWPVVRMILTYDNQAHVFKVLKVDKLPFPVLSGHDAPGFGTLVQTAVREVATEEKDIIPGTVW